MQEDEYLDIVDENDRIISKDLRSKIKKNGLPNNRSIRVVNIFIINSSGKILIPKRSMNRTLFPGCYDFSCGEHVMAGEDYDAAAQRGLKEELNIKEKLECLGKLTPKDGVSSFMKIYKLKYDKQIKKYDKDGIDRLHYYDLKTLKEILKQNKKKFKDDIPIVLKWCIKNKFLE